METTNYVEILRALPTGTIGLVHNKEDKLSKIIQEFQKKDDPIAGEYNHSFIVVHGRFFSYAAEETQIENRKIKAAFVETDLRHYLKDKYVVLFRTPLFSYSGERMELIIKEHLGIPYDYASLSKHQIIRTTTDKWTGRNGERAARKMVCHEAVMHCWNDHFSDLFTKWNEGNVAHLFHDIRFQSKLMWNGSKFVEL